jgi:hypothetical protein
MNEYKRNLWFLFFFEIGYVIDIYYKYENSKIKEESTMTETAILWIIISFSVFALIMFITGIVRALKEGNPLGLLLAILMIVALIIFV